MSKGATRLKPKKRVLTWISIRKRLQPILIGLCACVAMLSVGYVSIEWINRDISQLKITAPITQVPETEIRQQLSGLFPSSFFYLDVNKVRNELLDIPMVRDASVKKIWPDTLEIQLQEEIPVARWNRKFVLSHDGDILPVATNLIDLPNLEGEQGDSHVVMKHFHLFSRWGKTHNIELSGLKNHARGWRLDMQGDIQIWLDQENALEGLKRLGRVLDRVDLKKIASIDLRYEQGFAVAWKAPAPDETLNEENVI